MRRIEFAEGEYYHLYNRGVDKRIIFTSHAEHQRFLAYLYLFNDIEVRRLEHTLKTKDMWEAKPPKSPLVAIGAYCLMPNHFHLYVTPLVEGGISKFMQRVLTAYTMFFNERHQRSGALFQGTFKAEHAANEAYARYLYAYIHLNPAKLKEPKWQEKGANNLHALRKFVNEYAYSSLREYRDRKHLITSPQHFPGYMKNSRDIDQHIDEWLRYRDEKLGG